MNKKRIALVGYTPDYFRSFGNALEESHFEVFWVHGTRSTAKYHENNSSTGSVRCLDTTANFRQDLSDVARCKKALSELESAGNPRINDVILMDRILRNKHYLFALCYLNHLQQLLSRFFTENSISLVSSGRDTALQIISMLVCRKLGIPWVVPTRVRIPQEMYMFASGHETGSIVNIRASTNKDHVWAEEFLRKFNRSPDKPALKAAARTFADVIKMMPNHARLFLSLVKTSFVERGNDYSRYTVSRIISMYLKRRLNMIMFKAFPPYSPVGDQPYCLYALHTQPESSIDVSGSYFSDQIALITYISRSLPASHELYVKIHPTDLDGKPLSFYRKIAKLPGVRLINYDVDSRDLIRQASIIFALTGTIGYEAGLIGQNVVTFAQNYFNRMPTVHYCDSPPRLPALIGSLLSAKPPEDLKERLIAFLANLKAQSFQGEINRMSLPNGEHLTQQDLKTLQGAYNSLYAVLASPKLSRQSGS